MAIRFRSDGSWTSTILNRSEIVSSLNFCHSYFKMRIPLAATADPSVGVLGMVSPSHDILLRIEVGHGYSETVRSPHAFRSEEAGHGCYQLFHTLGGLSVSIVTFGALRREDHSIIRRAGEFRKLGRRHEAYFRGTVERRIPLIRGSHRLVNVQLR